MVGVLISKELSYPPKFRNADKIEAIELVAREFE